MSHAKTVLNAVRLAATPLIRQAINAASPSPSMPMGKKCSSIAGVAIS